MFLEPAIALLMGVEIIEDDVQLAIREGGNHAVHEAEEDGTLIAAHPVLEGRHQRRVAPAHRKMARIVDPPRDKPILILRTGDVVAARPLDFYQAVGRRLACQGDQP